MGLTDNIQVNVNSLWSNNSSQLYKTVVLKQRDAIFQQDISIPNTKYIIKWNYDLLGETIHIPENCFLQFDGGSFFNGTLVCDDTQIISYQEDDVIFNNITLEGTYTRYNKFNITVEDYVIGEDEELVQAYKTITINLGKESISFNTIVLQKIPIQYYRITFETVGGNQIESVRIKKNTSTTLPVPTKSEHVFEGWYNNENYSGNPCPNVYIPTSDITLYAKWRKIPYTVTFSSNYESGESNSSYIPSGDSINIAEAPNRIGYTFVSWNTEADGTGISYNPGVPYTVTGNITFYAQWQINRYTVTFNPNYGSGITPTSIEVNYGTSLTNLNYPSLTRTGYTLLSWNINANGAGTNPSTVVNNITLYAQWQRNVPNTLTMYSFRTPQTDNYESASRTTPLTKNTETLIETALKYHYIPVETEISVTKQEWGLNGIETITIGTCVYDSTNDRYIYKIEDINLIGEEIKYN